MNETFSNKVFPIQASKSELHYEIWKMQIKFDSKFHIQQTILILGIKFAQKGYFQLKTKTMNITNEFSIF